MNNIYQTDFKDVPMFYCKHDTLRSIIFYQKRYTRFTDLTTAGIFAHNK